MVAAMRAAEIREAARTFDPHPTQETKQRWAIEASAQLAEPATQDEFPVLIRLFRLRSLRTRNDLAKSCRVDPSYLARIEYGDREPPNQVIIEAIARELKLTPFERNRLLVSAGYAPLSVAQLGHWHETLQVVTDVLNDIHLSPKEREDFGQLVKLLATRWVPQESMG